MCPLFPNYDDLSFAFAWDPPCSVALRHRGTVGATVAIPCNMQYIELPIPFVSSMHESSSLSGRYVTVRDEKHPTVQT
jgi:hypothetical protein